MKTALKEKYLIHLDKLDRSLFQQTYEDSKKGLYHCPVCSETVTLYLGIHQDPFFQHKNKNNHCQDLISQSEVAATVEQPQTKIVNGFSLPQSKPVTSSTTVERNYKSTVTIKNLPPFEENNQTSLSSHPSEYIKELYHQNIYLDAQQIEAVIHPNGSLLVLAGAGSGKTRVLTARTAFLLTEKQVDANRIMLVTFTAKAAAEMKKRLLSYPYINQNKVQRLISGTFHSIFYRILSHHEPQKWNSTKLLNREWQRRQIVKEAGRELQLDEKEFAYDAALQQIGFWKNSLLSPEKVKPTTSFDEKAVHLYKKYEEFKKAQELFDFDDMLTGCYELFVHQAELLETYQNRFDYFLIDEFQDINKVQYELIKMLSARTKNVFVVGDDDQSIYGFRGSNPHYLREFEKDFPEADVVILSENYRSSHSIVATANKMIQENKQRRIKNMHAQFTNEFQPAIFFPFDEEEEATMILTDMKEKISAGRDPGDFAILFRTNTGSRAIFERLANSNLPFTIDMDMESFYERFMIKSMLAFLRLAVNEDNQYALSDIFPALFLKQSVLNDVKANSILNDCTLLESLKFVKTNFPFQEKKLKKVAPVIRSLPSLSPLQAIEKVEKDLGFQDFIKKRGNEGDQWDKGSDDIRDLKVAAKNFTSITEFLEHSDHMAAMNKEMKKQSKNKQNAVTLSTIHRSKGLEYHIVYILGVVDGSIPHEYALDAYRSGDHELLEEERRLLYVAATRAKEALYMSVPQNYRGKKAYRSRFLTTLR